MRPSFFLTNRPAPCLLPAFGRRDDSGRWRKFAPLGFPDRNPSHRARTRWRNFAEHSGADSNRMTAWPIFRPAYFAASNYFSPRSHWKILNSKIRIVDRKDDRRRNRLSCWNCQTTGRESCCRDLAATRANLTAGRSPGRPIPRPARSRSGRNRDCCVQSCRMDGTRSKALGPDTILNYGTIPAAKNATSNAMWADGLRDGCRRRSVRRRLHGANHCRCGNGCRAGCRRANLHRAIRRRAIRRRASETSLLP